MKELHLFISKCEECVFMLIVPGPENNPDFTSWKCQAVGGPSSIVLDFGLDIDPRCPLPEAEHITNGDRCWCNPVVES